MAGVAGHTAVTVGELVVAGCRVAPRRIVFLDRLGVSRLDIVVAILRVDGVLGLFYSPPEIRIDNRILDNVAFFELRCRDRWHFSVLCQP